jgi:hypothetical protein
MGQHSTLHILAPPEDVAGAFQHTKIQTQALSGFSALSVQCDSCRCRSTNSLCNVETTRDGVKLRKISGLRMQRHVIAEQLPSQY